MEPERGFEAGSAWYKGTALPFELSSIDTKANLVHQKSPKTASLNVEQPSTTQLRTAR